MDGEARVAEEPSGQPDGLLVRLGPGSLVAGYRLERRIGAGGMAVVFRAHEERLGRMVALKILPPMLSGDREFRGRFIRESRLATAVDDPHILPIYGAGEADGVLFIAMRLVTGGDLSSVIRREGPLAPGRPMSFIAPVAAALDAAHDAGLVHRDVKPANILVDIRPGRPEHVYLSDFGLSKSAMSVTGLTGTGQFMGTPDYCAPEQIAGQPVTGQADQYTLGCVAFTLLTGQMPFVRDEPMAAMWAHVSQPPPSMTALRPDLPEAVDHVMARVLAKAPEDRFRDCQEFTAALGQALRAPRSGPRPMSRTPASPAFRTPTVVPQADHASGAATHSARRGQVPGPAAHRRRRRALWTGVMVGVVVVLVAGGIVVEGSILSAPRTRSLPPPQHTPAAATLAGTLTDPGGESVGAIAFGDNGTTLTTADADGSAYVWNTRTRGLMTTLTGFGSPVGPASFSPGADELATYDGQSVAVWNLTTQQRIGTVSSSDCPCALGPGGTEIAATYSSIERLAVISDVSAGTIEGTFAGEGTTSHLATLALSADGELLAVNYVDHRTYLFDIQANRDLGALTGSGSEGTNEMVFSADGTTLATGDKNGSTYVWNVATHHLIAALPDPDRAAIELVALSPDGKLLATSGGSGRVYLWNVSRHKIIATVPAPGQETPFCAAFSPSGTTLAVTGNDKTYLYNLHT
jgi:hypothetical protein